MRTCKQIVVALRLAAPAALILIALVASILAAPGSAHAGCMVAPTPELRELAELAATKPLIVLDVTKGTKFGDPAAGWLLAARAEAYDTLSRPADARQIATLVLERNKRLPEALRVELLTRYAMNGFSKAEIDQASREIMSVRESLVQGSAADTCLQVALGEMERMRGAPERAIVFLADAYRATVDSGSERRHVLATEKLARVVDWAGDHLQAISLIEEVIAYDRSRHRTIALSTDLYFRGVFQLGRHDYRSAHADFEQARLLAPAGIDPVGFAFLDLQTCATLVELDAFERAKVLCDGADRTFERFGEIAQAQARFLLARIAIAQGQPLKGLVLLNQLLAKHEALSSFASGPQAYRLRAQIYSRLGKAQLAYNDIEAYLITIDQQRSSEQIKQSAVLRARFDADRTAARNTELR